MQKASIITEEQKKYLLANEYVAEVTDKNVYFTTSFKEKFLELMNQGVRHRKIFISLGIDPDILGYNRCRSFIYHLKDDIRCGRGIVGYTTKDSVLRASDTSDERLRKVMTELEYVKQENSFLKKLVAVGKKNAKHRD